MSNTGGNAETSYRENFDRRVHPRRPVPSLAYVKLHEGNGGIILNASEGGLAVQAAASLTDDVLPAVRFQLPQSRTWVELRVRAAWIGDSRKVAGLEFLDLSEETRTQIKEWLSSEGAPPAKKKVELPPKGHGRDPAPPPAVVAPLRAPARAPTTTPPANSSFATIFARSHAAQPSIRGLSVAGASHRPRRRGSRGTPITLAVIGIILVSLAAGWASGHGVFSKILQGIPSISWYHNAADPDAMPRSAGRIAPISQIEIVDGNNQRWAISFNGPMNASAPSPRWQNSGRAPAPVSPPQIPFQTWVLSAPVRSSGDTAGNGQERENAPVLPNGAENASPTSLGLPAPSSLTSPQPAPPAQKRGADLRPGDLILRVEPIYPAIAKEHGIGGTVKLRVTVGPDGIVRGLELVSGPQVLVGAARTAVLQWRYAPTTLDGQAIETEKEITLVFQSPQP